MLVNRSYLSINTEDFLKKVNQISLVESYLGGTIKLDQNIVSPIRTDPQPGCRFAVDNKNNLILFDYSKGKSYNAISLIAEYNGWTYIDTREQLINDYYSQKKLQIPNQVIQVPQLIYKEKEFNFYPNYRSFTESDCLFWSISDLIITKEILDKYKIKALTSYILNSFEHKPSLCYLFEHSFFQIYKPLEKKELRYRAKSMLGLHGKSHLTTLDYVIITKSFRDWFYLQQLGFNSLFVLKEGHNFTEDEQLFLKKFKKVFLLFDNDLTGITAMQKWNKELGYLWFYYPVDDGKDTVDMLIKYKSNTVKSILINYICEESFQIPK